MNLELTDREVGLTWEALTEYIAECSQNEQKAQELEAIRTKIEKLSGDDTG